MSVSTAMCVAMLSLPWSAPGQWRSTEDAETCVAGTGNPSLDIAVCGRALGRDLTDLDRASVHSARGRAYRDSGKTANALADFDAALALNPHSADAYNERALTLDTSGHYQRALDDFERALALSPRFAAAYKNRALAHFYAGDPACARTDLDAAGALFRADGEIYALRGMLHYLAGRYRYASDDFERVHALALPYAYLPLWRYLAGVASGDPDPHVLAEARAELRPGEWPQPLLDVYLEKIAPDTLLTELDQQAPGPERRRRFAASHYYLAALARLHGRPARAREHLTQSVMHSGQRVPEAVLAEQALAATDGSDTARTVGSVDACLR